MYNIYFRTNGVFSLEDRMGRPGNHLPSVYAANPYRPTSHRHNPSRNRPNNLISSPSRRFPSGLGDRMGIPGNHIPAVYENNRRWQN